MKKLIYICILIAAFSFSSCEGSLDDTINEINEVAERDINEYEYTISSDDYEDIVPSNDKDYYEENERFENEEDALEKIPLILNKYFVGGEGDKVTAKFNIVSDEEETLGETIETSLNFKYDAELATYVEDGAIVYLLIDDDYDLVGSSSLADDDTFSSQISNLNQYGNFNRDGGSTNWDDSQIEAALNIVLAENFPEAEDEDIYEVTYSIFNGATTTETKTLQFIDGEFSYYVEE